MADRGIQNVDQALRWIKEGRTYKWMVEEHERLYGIRVATSTFSNLRVRYGLPRRINRDDGLIPWKVKPEHRWNYQLQLLRAEARARAGLPLKPHDAERLPGWHRTLERENVVIHYDPDLPDGFVYVPREKTDTDIIRRPARPSAKRRAS